MKCCELTAGMLRHQIQIREQTDTPDGYGGQVKSWVTIHTVNAKIDPVSGYERTRSMQLNAVVTHKIFVRYIAGIEASQQIVFNDRQFQIRFVKNIEERNRWLELTCEEGVAQ